MALVLADRIKETTTTTGTGTITLDGAQTGFESFAGIGDGNTTYYVIQHTSANEFEVGLGTYTASGTTLSRDTIYTSSNSDAAVNFSAGTKIVFVAVPTEATVYEDASGDVAIEGQVTVGGDPTANLQVATKQYVDNLTAASIHVHEAVRVEKEGNLNATYDNGTAGVGATLTNAGTQAALVIDGVTLNTNDRVLVYEQTDQTQNGVYTVTNVGSASTNWVLTRATDADSAGEGSADTLDEGSYFYVQEGNAGAGESYVCNVSGTIVFGTTNITFAQFSATPEFTGGTNIDITNRVISVTGTVSNANQLDSLDSSQFLRSDAADTKTSGDLSFSDNVKAIFGAGSDLEIYHNGTSSFIEDTGSGDLFIRGAANVQIEGSTAGENMIYATENGAVRLYYDANQKLATTATGVDVTGTVTATTFTGNLTGSVTGNADTATTWQTARSLTLSGDVTGTATGINGSGNISVTTTIGANSVALGTDTTGNYVGALSEGTAIDISGGTGEGITNTISIDLNELATSTTNADGDYFVVVDSADGSQHKLTKANINISGFNNDSGFITSADGGNAATLDSLDSTQFLRSDAGDTKTSGNLSFSDNVKAIFGAGSDLQIYHDGSNSYVRDAGTGNLRLTSDSEIHIAKHNNEYMVRAYADGAVQLYYDNAEKLATTGGGIDVTGSINSSGIIESGEGSGSVALTTNDGYGNANLTFNHTSGVPDVNGSSYRIETAVDAASAFMNFEMASSTTAGTAVNLSQILRLDPQGADVTGAITATGDITAFSDERLKSDITTINNALDKVTAMRGVTFTKDGKVGSGVIAQEMEKVAPELVRTEEYKSVAYGNLVGYLIEAIKELKAEIEELKNGSAT